MTDNERMENVRKWAEFVRTHDRSVWKPSLKEFIDSQIIIGNRFYKRLEKTPNGKEKIIEIFSRK